jgi:hypothetical protein
MGMIETVNRRDFFLLASVLVPTLPRLFAFARAQSTSPQMTLLSAPLELAGDWGASPSSAVLAVLSRMREVSLSGLRLLSDQQPDRIRVDEHTSGPPAIWLHKDPPQTAWIIVDIGARDWCKLAYQFGHELGHVLCNSWGPQAKPQPPSQWLEEALVEAFSIRGLGLLADSWGGNPPFAGDASFAGAIRQYRADLVAKYRKEPVPGDDLGAWLCSHRDSLPQGVSEDEGPAILATLAELEDDKSCVEDLGAVNRWPERTGLPIQDYLTRWQASCAELGADGRLPVRLRARLGLAG